MKRGKDVSEHEHFGAKNGSTGKQRAEPPNSSNSKRTILQTSVQISRLSTKVLNASD
jgi:hypothetical protein